MKISDAIIELLHRQNSPHVGHYHAALELQIDPVDTEMAEKLGIAVSLYPIRVPKNGSTVPLDNDGDMPYPSEVAQRFGTSGWNWRDRQSEFVVFDFDSSQGHEAGLSEGELREVQQAAGDLPYVEVYRSKSGNGLHFYVFLDGVMDVLTRRDHRLVSLAVIARMSKDSGFSFSEKSDCEGVIAWLWSRDAAPNGFELVKKATEKLKLPSGWREAMITAHRRSRVRRDGELVNSVLTDFAAANDDAQLDEHHEAIIEWLYANGWACELDECNGTPLLRTHTMGLKGAHLALRLRGVFETDSAATNSRKPNCYCFFRSDGRLVVRRYGSGCREAATWRKDGGNWTHCNYNEDPDFNVACRSAGGVPTGRDNYRFDNHEAAIAVIRLLGSELVVPHHLQGRPIFVPSKAAMGEFFSR